MMVKGISRPSSDLASGATSLHRKKRRGSRQDVSGGNGIKTSPRAGHVERNSTALGEGLGTGE